MKCTTVLFDNNIQINLFVKAFLVSLTTAVYFEQLL